MKNLTIIFSLTILALVIYAFSKKEKSARFDYLGQTIPPDMEFIPGDSAIPSFFISKSEETNLNYLSYLNWLKRVYVDYPELETNAEPHDLPYSELTKFNDPILKGQLRNPAFAYYPVTGVDWIQVQDYLCWKTDRLNEAILVDLKYFKENPDQVNEDNFNYEAFMARQYEGAVRKIIPGMEYTFSGETEIHKYSTTYPFLFPGYRLPTEEEWEYASKEEFSNNHISKGETYPYGKKYFLLNFLTHRLYGGDYALKPYAKNAGAYEPADMNRMKGGTTYDNRHYGVYNMGNNVKEWIMDIYTPEKQHYPNMESVYVLNGFILAQDSMYKNAEGKYKKKDNSGRMPYRTMGVSANGDDFRVMQYRYRLFRDSVSRIPNPDSVKIRLAQKEKLVSVYRQMRTYRFYNGYDYNNPWLFYYDGGTARWMNLQNYRVDTVTLENGEKREQLVLDTNKIMNSPEFVEERLYITKRFRNVVYEPSVTFRNRVIKSGTWKNPSTSVRESMRETEASADVGFRTVIPYMGMPIDKKNMVKWK
jgi:formylglycine-generating enzyme required for sulfatase activity